MGLYVDIGDERVPVEIKHVDFWLAEFIENWKCPHTHSRHAKGDTAQVPGDPYEGERHSMTMGSRHYGAEHQVPFTVLKFRHIEHTIYTLRHRTTEITEGPHRESNSC